MANELARNIQDASLNPAAFALPAAASSATHSAILDIGGDTYDIERLELDIALPALTTTIVPDGDTVTVSIETSTSSSFASVDCTIFSRILTGAGGAGIPAQAGLRARLPSNSARYVRATVTFGASTTTGAAVSATFTLRF